ncbi:MAG TPA: glycerol kinase GlpK [Alphaproteobacteria bacterium]|nr:glycerol kinase GlpK [Alphaproteobacteria bacterium]
MKAQHLLALDQGTTSTRAIVFDAGGSARGTAQIELPQIFPQPGWVEHDPEEIWRASQEVMRRAVDQARLTAADIAAIGITNQRETTILWDRASGKPIHNAIVWQDRRTAEWCRRMKARIGDAALGRRTGLLFDAYFSASKIAWMLDHVAGARRAAQQGRLAFGTVDSFLLWRLTGGRRHVTDATNASRTMLFNLDRQDWDDELLEQFRIPRAILPEVRDSADEFGDTDLLGHPVPIAGVAGDQQAATVGQACFKPGMIKSTYGTGCFAVLNTGTKRVRSRHRLLTTLAYRLGGRPVFAIEGSIFVSGATVQWLRDQLKVIGTAAESEAQAGGVEGTGGVYLVPAFAGLGAPHWDPDARGALVGLTRDSGIPQIVRAGLEAVAYQTRDLMAAMGADGARPAALRVDGGMVVNDWMMQFLADQLGLPVERPAVTETTAWGAACLAGLGAGLFASTAEIATRWRRERVFKPQGAKKQRDALYAGWLDAVRRVRSPSK